MKQENSRIKPLVSYETFKCALYKLLRKYQNTSVAIYSFIITLKDKSCSLGYLKQDKLESKIYNMNNYI